MVKPANPYKRGTLSWNLMEGDWADLTVRQIAEVLDVMPHSINEAMLRIKRKTGYEVPHKQANRGEVKVMTAKSKGHLE